MSKFGKVMQFHEQICICDLRSLFCFKNSFICWELFVAMTELTKAMCWELVSITKDTVNGVGIATYKKPSSNDCYQKRSVQEPPLCEKSDDSNAAW